MAWFGLLNLNTICLKFTQFVWNLYIYKIGMLEFCYLKYSYKNKPEFQAIIYETITTADYWNEYWENFQNSGVLCHRIYPNNLLRDIGLASYAVHQTRKSSAGAQ